MGMKNYVPTESGRTEIVSTCTATGGPSGPNSARILLSGAS
jgi:hypothetical protein